MSRVSAVCRSIWNDTKELTGKRLASNKKVGERTRARRVSSTEIDGAHSHDVGVLTEILSTEGRGTYMKLRGDHLLHLAEMARHCDLVSAEENEYATEALDAYLSAQRAVSGCTATHYTGADCSADGDCPVSESGKSLPELHPLRLELAYKSSLVLFHFLGRCVDAWEIAYPVYVKATENPTRLGPRGLLVVQLLRDHLASISPQEHALHQEEEHQNLTSHGGVSLQSEAWGFLRISSGEIHSARNDGSSTSRIVAEVKQARMHMEGIAKVLLGTMSNAGKVLSKLKQIFEAYVKANPVKPLRCPADGETVWYQGTDVKLQNFRLQGPLLSWTGFETLCYNFSIATPYGLNTDTPARVRRTIPSNRPLGRQDSTYVSSAVEMSREARGYLLTGSQALVIYLSAGTHGSVVASFPYGSSKLAAQVAAGVARGEREVRSHEEEQRYWKNLEQMVVSGLMPQGSGLNFPQFIDALARCGLIGFASEDGRGSDGAGRHSSGRLSASIVKRVQAIFVRHMNLLDDDYVKQRCNGNLRRCHSVSAAESPAT